MVGYDGARNVRDEGRSVGRKKRVRKAEPRKPPPEKRDRLKQHEISLVANQESRCTGHQGFCGAADNGDSH